MKAKSLCCLYDKNISTGRKSEYNSEEYNTKVVFIDLLSLQDIQLYNDISSIHPVLDLKSYIYTYKYNNKITLISYFNRTVPRSNNKRIGCAKKPVFIAQTNTTKSRTKQIPSVRMRFRTEIQVTSSSNNNSSSCNIYMNKIKYRLLQRIQLYQNERHTSACQRPVQATFSDQWPPSS